MIVTGRRPPSRWSWSSAFGASRIVSIESMVPPSWPEDSAATSLGDARGTLADRDVQPAGEARGTDDQDVDGLERRRRVDPGARTRRPEPGTARAGPAAARRGAAGGGPRGRRPAARRGTLAVRDERRQDHDRGDGHGLPAVDPRAPLGSRVARGRRDARSPVRDPGAAAGAA